MTLAVDASTLVAALVDTSEEGRWAESVIASEPLVAPELVMAESSNILRRLELAGVLAPMESGMAHQDLLRLDIQLFPFHPFAERVWELRFNATSYDAWYIALAEMLDCPLATLDSKLMGAAAVKCQFMHP